MLRYVVGRRRTIIGETASRSSAGERETEEDKRGRGFERLACSGTNVVGPPTGRRPGEGGWDSWPRHAGRRGARELGAESRRTGAPGEGVATRSGGAGGRRDARRLGGLGNLHRRRSRIAALRHGRMPRLCDANTGVGGAPADTSVSGGMGGGAGVAGVSAFASGPVAVASEETPVRGCGASAGKSGARVRLRSSRSECCRSRSGRDSRRGDCCRTCGERGCQRLLCDQDVRGGGWGRRLFLLVFTCRVMRMGIRLPASGEHGRRGRGSAWLDGPPRSVGGVWRPASGERGDERAEGERLRYCGEDEGVDWEDAIGGEVRASCGGEEVGEMGQAGGATGVPNAAVLHAHKEVVVAARAMVVAQAEQRRAAGIDELGPTPAARRRVLFHIEQMQALVLVGVVRREPVARITKFAAAAA
ncbi:hypothetical protein Efla_004055 [Eimeria flavescens]